ncbi:MAG: nucleotidyltransferase family protein [Jhaorihella sp.]
MKPDAIMLFAAGFGTRMGALTRTRPKPMIPVAGRPMIDYALALARDVAPARIVANLHYLPQQLEAHLAPQGVALSHEHPDILDTGGGLKAALPLLGTGPVYTLNTDAIWVGPNPLRLLQAAWDPERMDALLTCVPPAGAIGHAGKGDFLAAPDGRLRRGPGLIFGGAQIVKPGTLDAFDKAAFSMNLPWDRMLQEGRLFGLVYPGRWCDVGHPGGISLAEKLLEEADV